MYLLVVILYFTNPQGYDESLGVVTHSFSTLENCNAVGRNLREIIEIPDHIKTVSYCVTPDDYFN